MLCLENLPQHLKNEGKGRKKRGNGKKNMCREGKRIFSNVLGKIFIKNLPQHLKNRVKGKKKRERGRKKLCRDGKRVFSKVLGKAFNNVMS